MITRLEIIQGTREKCLEEFYKIVPTVFLQKGCIEYDAYVDSEDDRFNNIKRPDIVIFVEKWESIEALQHHSKSDVLKGFREKIRDIKVNSEYELLIRK